MRADLVDAYKQAGMPPPSAAVLTKRVNETQPLIKALEGAPPDVQRRVLEATLGRPGFLAIPASVGLGANALMQDYPQ